MEFIGNGLCTYSVYNGRCTVGSQIGVIDKLIQKGISYSPEVVPKAKFTSLTKWVFSDTPNKYAMKTTPARKEHMTGGLKPQRATAIYATCKG
jgi:hypothetical protein